MSQDLQAARPFDGAYRESPALSSAAREFPDRQMEQQWLDQARQGDDQSFSRLVEAFQGPVYNLAYRMLSDPGEAEEAAQETFIRAYTRLAQYDPERKFSTWVLSIANHHCIDRLRKRRAILVSIDDNPVLENLQGDAPQPETALMDKERSRHVQALIDQLEPDYRTPVVLRYWQEYSYQEIAETMGISVSAVKSRLFRARQKLAEIYQDAEAEGLAAQAAASPGVKPPPSVRMHFQQRPAPVGI